MNQTFLLEFCQTFVDQTLLGLAIASTSLCLLAVLVTSVSRKQSAAARFWTWQMTGSGVLLAAVVLLSTTGIPLFSSSNSSVDIAFATPFSSGISSSRKLPVPSAAPMMHPDKTNAKLRPQRPIFAKGNAANASDSFSALSGPSDYFVADAVTKASAADTPRGISWAAFAATLFLVWLLVFISHTVWFVRCVWGCYRIAGRATVVDAPQAMEAFRSASNRIEDAATGLRGKTKKKHYGTQSTLLLVSDELEVPFTIGVVRPKIVLPSSFQDWSTEKLEMVIAHELAHIERRDIPWHWLNRFSCCLVWFNPLIWMAARQGIFERERACDDWVIRSGISPIDYGKNLVEIAAMMSGRHIEGGVSMAEPPLKQRLHWILSKAPNRQASSWLFRATIALSFFVLAGLTGLLRPMAVAKQPPSSTRNPELSSPSSSPASQLERSIAVQDKDGGAIPSTASPDDKTIRLPESLTGVVQAHDGIPLADVTVELNLYYFKRIQGDESEYVKLGTCSGTTDAQGKYTVDTREFGDLPENTNLSLEYAYHPSAPEGGRTNWSGQKVAQTGIIPVFRFKQGRKVTGQIVDADGKPIRAIIRSAGSTPNPNHAWFPRAMATNEDGTFQLFVPVDYHVELLAFAQGHAAKRIAIPGNEEKPPKNQPSRVMTSFEVQDINDAAESNDIHNAPFDAGKVRLDKGTVVKGQLLDLNGKPIEGVVVGLETAYDTKIRGVAFDASYASKTDAQGRFKFPPATGITYVFVNDRVHDSTLLANFSVYGPKPPHVSPVRFDIDELKLADGTAHEVTLRSVTAKQTISGNIKWDDGSPAVGVKVTGGASPNVKLGSVFSDENGNYAIELPRPLNNANVYVMGAKDKFGKWHSAIAYRKGKVTSHAFQVLDGNETGVNWVLRELRSIPPKTPEYVKARGEFVKLQRMSQVFWDKLQKAEQAAQTPEEEMQAYQELDPRNAMAKYYLAFEEKYRGKRAAFLAINAGMGSAVSVGGSETNASKGRNEMVSRLMLHYLDHEDLGSTFGNMSGGPPVHQRYEILDAAIKHSPHRQVRAQAMLYRAEYVMEDLRYAEMLPLIRPWHEEQMNRLPLRMQEETRQQLARLEAIDIEKSRAEAIRWLDVIDTEYNDLRIQAEGSYYQKKTGTVTPGLRYSLSKIVVGQPVPEFDLPDINGKPIKLSELKGKPIVLTLCFDHGGRLEGQELAKEFEEQDVEFVTVLGTDDLGKFNKKFPRETIVGAIASESLFQGKMRLNWSVNSATTVLIDKAGVLQAVGSFDEATKRWLKNQLE